MMAKMRCKCGTILRDDDPHDTFFILSDEEFDVELSGVLLFGRAQRVVRCKVCQRLWFWAENGELTEYLKGEVLTADSDPLNG
ncbi:hypothetical protein QRX60_48935 [Amycolatopsis mongoliensis]|uniref:Uncharacterized protein n=1 Tax=Amycolatopsis mongoliensis TaxID=715475 RepID=A0A9Y2JQW4_9PSEU|nr:hypothetical protein [Amycolatopsis sp. 4-36]WIY01852.1 hypothetical protein QRX60_48935 [Amycolatopsis sp. 4-36]